MMLKKISTLLLSMSAFLTFMATAQALPKNMHMIDEDKSTGFEIYRSSTPSTNDVRQWCKMGITEVYVLSGDAKERELLDPTACPGLKVMYNISQKAAVPLDTNFLNQFDNWVKDAQANGKKILFRCNCGCHRTGRLAAYYRMKYNGYSSSQAINEMYDLGKWMFFYSFLKPQVRALHNYANGVACSQSSKYCVKMSKPQLNSADNVEFAVSQESASEVFQ